MTVLSRDVETPSRVLVVDDDITTRLLACQTLTQQGFSVAEAESGRQALELFEAVQPHVVLLDVDMPDLDGYEVCRQLRTLPGGKTVPILMITGLHDIAAIESAYQSGATDFESKPLNWLLLNHRIRYMIRASAALQELQALKALRKAEEKIYDLAYLDSLTGLANRRLFKEEAKCMLELAKRHGRLSAVLFLDLDDFKRINDTLGHNAGDKLLLQVADRLRVSLRKTDTIARNDAMMHHPVARLGGDEFTVLLAEIQQEEDAASVAQRILEALTQPMRLVGHEVVVTSSIGIAIYPRDGQNIDGLLQSADTAMYHAKNGGKKCFSFYTESMNRLVQRRLKLENHLRNALKQKELELHYQPLIDLANGSVLGVEALLRWQSAELGLVSPEEFIPVAEATGMIVPIGEWVLRRACAQTRTWQGVQSKLKVAVNVSARQFAQPNFQGLVLQVLEDTGLQPECLELEITENLLMDDNNDTTGTLNHLKALGVQLAIDDFGTGYSSLSYLTRLPIDRLKVDKLFIANVASDSDGNTRAVLQAVMAMAHSLGLSVTAEGVETDAQLSFLQTIGCDEVQGYYFSRPLRAEQVYEILNDSPF